MRTVTPIGDRVSSLDHCLPLFCNCVLCSMVDMGRLECTGQVGQVPQHTAPSTRSPNGCRFSEGVPLEMHTLQCLLQKPVHACMHQLQTRVLWASKTISSCLKRTIDFNHLCLPCVSIRCGPWAASSAGFFEALGQDLGQARETLPFYTIFWLLLTPKSYIHTFASKDLTKSPA